MFDSAETRREGHTAFVPPVAQAETTGPRITITGDLTRLKLTKTNPFPPGVPRKVRLPPLKYNGDVPVFVSMVAKAPTPVGIC